MMAKSAADWFLTVQTQNLHDELAIRKLNLIHGVGLT